MNVVTHGAGWGNPSERPLYKLIKINVITVTRKLTKEICLCITATKTKNSSYEYIERSKYRVLDSSNTPLTKYLQKFLNNPVHRRIQTICQKYCSKLKKWSLKRETFTVQLPLILFSFIILLNKVVCYQMMLIDLI